MINITLKVDDEEVETTRWMKEVWKEDWLVKPNNMEVQIDKLCDTEKEYLNKVMQWVYTDGTIAVNGKEYDVKDLLRG